MSRSEKAEQVTCKVLGEFHVRTGINLGKNYETLIRVLVEEILDLIKKDETGEGK